MSSTWRQEHNADLRRGVGVIDLCPYEYSSSDEESATNSSAPLRRPDAPTNPTSSQQSAKLHTQHPIVNPFGSARSHSLRDGVSIHSTMTTKHRGPMTGIPCTMRYFHSRDSQRRIENVPPGGRQGTGDKSLLSYSRDKEPLCPNMMNPVRHGVQQSHVNLGTDQRERPSGLFFRKDYHQITSFIATQRRHAGEKTNKSFHQCLLPRDSAGENPAKRLSSLAVGGPTRSKILSKHPDQALSSTVRQPAKSSRHPNSPPSAKTSGPQPCVARGGTTAAQQPSPEVSLVDISVSGPDRNLAPLGIAEAESCTPESALPVVKTDLGRLDTGVLTQRNPDRPTKKTDASVHFSPVRQKSATTYSEPVLPNLYDRIRQRKRNQPSRFGQQPSGAEDKSSSSAPHKAPEPEKKKDELRLLNVSSARDRLLESYNAYFPIEPPRESKTVCVRNLVQSQLNYPQITPIQHLTKEYKDANSLPVKELTFYGGNDDILYTIRLSVQKSKFKGFGAFLTYLGALKLDESIHKIGKRMLGKRTHFVPQTALALQGVDVDGWEKTVRVTGENLHRNNNNVYWPKNMLPMFAVAEGTGRRTTVYLSGEAALEDDQDFKDTKFMEERLADMKQKGLQPIGHLGLYCIDDYKPAPGQYFDLMGSQIDIGRYGPWSNADRKPLSVFEIKSFLFKQQPLLYPFEADTALNGELQIIDVTDDATGLPHDAAKARIPMYVNEVGHHLENKQTVFSTISEDGRVCHYNIALYDDFSMHEGSTLELLTNYFDKYENMRESEGYGLKNVYHGLPSIDDDIATRVQHGIYDRGDVEHTLRNLCPVKLVDALEHVDEATCQPIQRLIETFLASGDHGPLSTLQVVASHHICWLRHKCLLILRSMENTVDEKIMSGKAHPIQKLSLQQSHQVLKGWKILSRLLSNLKGDSRRLGEGDPSIADVLRMETREDICFELKDHLKKPFDASVWCKISRSLVENLCDTVHDADILPWVEPDAMDEQSQSHLAAKFLEYFSQAARLIIDAARLQSLDLHFESGLTEDMVVRGTVSDILAVFQNQSAKNLDDCHEAAYLDLTTTSKLFTREVLRRLSYVDYLNGPGKSSAQTYTGEFLDHTERLVMIRTVPSTGSDSRMDIIRSTPRSVNGGGQYAINVEWYLLWQIAFPVLVFVNRYVPSRLGSIVDAMSKERLDRKWIDYALRRGMQDGSITFSKVCVPKTKIMWRKVSPFQNHTAVAADADAIADTLIDDDDMYRPRKRPSIGSRSGQRRFVRPRLSLEEACGGERPAGSGRLGISEKQKLLSEDIGDCRRQACGYTDTGRPIPQMVWSGKPDEKFFSLGHPINWPPGWTKRVYQRASGDSKGATDRYWFTPVENFKLRSLKEVSRFFDCMDACGQDESSAWRMFKGRR